jgi:adenylate kinase
LSNKSFTSAVVTARSDLFSSFGPPAKQKFLLLGSSPFSSENGMNQLRSLNIEHVSPAELIQQEISRGSSLGQTAERTIRQGSPLADETMIALVRRWFWSRKPDAGYALQGFPATLLQAKVFDEWLDARDENIHGVFASADSSESLVEHYRTLGLLIEGETLTAA